MAQLAMFFAFARLPSIGDHFFYERFNVFICTKPHDHLLV